MFGAEHILISAKDIFLVPNGIYNRFDDEEFNGIKYWQKLWLAVRSYPHIVCCVVDCISCRRTP